MEIDQDKLMEFLHKFVGDLGAAMSAGNVVVGDRLGLYRALADGPLLPAELAERTGTAARHVDEGVRGPGAGAPASPWPGPCPRGRCCPPSWPSGPAPRPATSTSGCAARRPAATSSTT